MGLPQTAVIANPCPASYFPPAEARLSSIFHASAAAPAVEREQCSHAVLALTLSRLTGGGRVSGRWTRRASSSAQLLPACVSKWKRPSNPSSCHAPARQDYLRESGSGVCRRTKCAFRPELPSARHCLRVQVPDLKPDRDLSVVGPSRTWMALRGCGSAARRCACLLSPKPANQGVAIPAVPIGDSPRGPKFLLPAAQPATPSRVVVVGGW